VAYIGNFPAEKYTTFSKQTFTPDGSTTSFTLDFSVANENDLELFVNNVRQEPGSGKAYTASGTTLTMSEAPGSSDTMYAVFQGKAVQTVTPASNSVTSAMIVDNAITSSKIASGAIANQSAYRNLIINGDMSIAQRGTSFALTASGATYTLDRMRHITTNLGAFTASQSTDVPTGQGFANSYKIDCTTADASPYATDSMLIQIRLEGQNIQHLKKGTSSAESLTLSFWVKSNKTGTYIAELFDRDNTRTISKAYTIDSANTWEKKTITYEGDTTGTLDNDNNASLDVHFWFGAGSDYTSGTLSTVWTTNVSANRLVGISNLADDTANELYITGIQLEVGTSASDFEFLPYDVNFSRCARYFYYLGVGNAQCVWLTGYASGSDWMVANYNFPTIMRTNSSLTQVGTWSYGNNSGSIGFSRQSPTATTFGFLSSGAGQQYAYNPSDGGVQFDAEL